MERREEGRRWDTDTAARVFAFRCMELSTCCCWDPLIGWASASQCSAQPLNWINEESHTGKKNKSIFKKISTRCVWNCNGENTWSQVISPPASHHLNFQTQGSKSTPPTAVNTQMDLNTIFWARSLQKKWKNAVVPMSEITGWQPKAAQVLLNSQGI